MSQNNKDKDTPPSIDDLISKERSDADNKTIDLDEFSLDNLSLDNFDSMLEKSPEPKKVRTNTELGDISVDLDFGVSDDKKKSGMDILDELDALSQAKVATPEPIIELDDKEAGESSSGLFGNSGVIDTNPPVASAIDEFEASVKADTSEQIDNADAESKSGDVPLAAIAPPPKPAKKSLFGSGKKDKPAKAQRAARPSKAGKSSDADSKRLMMIIIGAVIALILLIGVWFFVQGGEEPASVPEVPAVTESVVAPPSPTPEESAPVEVVDGGVPATDSGLPDTSAIDAAAAGTMPAGDSVAPLTNDVVAPPMPAPTTTETTPAPTVPVADDVQMIDVKSITAASIPEDPALIKEEIDRLNDKDGQFVEQAKLIDEQLSLMKDLTKQKEEQIALLEKQIAQLEKDKGAK